MIKVNNLVKRFGGLTAVKGVSFEVSTGEIFGLLGPNGAGKSTLMRMLVGLTKPTQGFATIDGFNCDTDRTTIHEFIGVVFEQPNLYEQTSVLRNLQLFARLYSVNKKEIERVIELFQLSQVTNQSVNTLSKGWKQRVLLARALLHDPRVIFLDEPTSGLDPNTAHMLRGIIQSLQQQGKTIILCTHNMEEAEILCDRIGLMHQGDFVALKSVAQFKQRDMTVNLAIVVSTPNGMETHHFPIYSAEALVFLDKHLPSQKIVSITTEEPSLTDVFKELTDGVLA